MTPAAKGERFGHWEVLDPVPVREPGKPPKLRCLCTLCGATKALVDRRALQDGFTSRCKGCPGLRGAPAAPAPVKPGAPPCLPGETFGPLTSLGEVAGASRRLVRVRCPQGHEATPRLSDLRHGRARGCKACQMASRRRGTAAGRERVARAQAPAVSA